MPRAYVNDRKCDCLDCAAEDMGTDHSWPVGLSIWLFWFQCMAIPSASWSHAWQALSFDVWQDSFTCDTCVPDEPFSSRAGVNDQTALGASLGVSLGAAIGIGLGVGLGISAGLGAYIAAGFVQLSVMNAEEIRSQNGVAVLLEIQFNQKHGKPVHGSFVADVSYPQINK